MSSINLEKSMERVKKYYIGKDSEGKHVIDGTNPKDELMFNFAMFRVSLAIENKELTQDELIKYLEKQ